MPLVIRCCLCVALFVRRRKHNCCLPQWKSSIFRLAGVEECRICSIIYVFLLAELNEVLDRLKQGPSQSPQRIETSDTSGDETDASKGRRKILSEKTFRMKKVYSATELGRFIVTGPSNAANMPSHFYNRVCRKNVSVLTHGHHDLLRHFQGSRHFARDQLLRLDATWVACAVFAGKSINWGWAGA